MSQQIVECVANFSAARERQVVDAIVAAIGSVEGVQVLDVQSDNDHNRSVVTFVGAPGPVGEAAVRGTAKAAELINLDQHQGEHPRLGATDVVPFIPISGVTMAECVALAREVGRRIGEELSIPVYLYEEAATRPQRKNLADIRKGEYELLREELGVVAAREPDFGPAKISPAGATVVGARQPLIAYNVYLNTGDVEIAKRIGKAVRHLSGGLRYVKALGLLVDGRAQISMNLVNYRGTPIHRVVEMIRSEAARHGVTITEGEVVGLIPQDALFDAAEHYLQLNNFRRDQVLERRLLSAQAEEQGGSGSGGVAWVPSETLRAFAAGTPTPGGGSASALAASLAASLGQMVANLTVGRKRYAEVEERMRAHLDRLELLGRELSALAVEDSAAYEAVMAANKLPKADDAQVAARDRAIQEANARATMAPLTVARKAVEVLEQLQGVAEYGNPNARTDAQVAALLAHAAVRGAVLNVQINLDGIADEGLRTSHSNHGSDLKRRAKELLSSIVGEE